MRLAGVPVDRIPTFLRWSLLAGWALAGCASGAVSPSDLQGSWEVRQVAVDHRDQPHWAYYPDDPRLLGRELDITASAISLGDGSRVCTAPVLSSEATIPLQGFFGQQFSRPEHFGTPTAPTLQDFGIEPADSSVTPLRLACTPDASPWNGAWLVLLPSGELLTNFDNSGYVLVLRRLDKRSPAKASFDCATAGSAPEQAICASPGLARYHLSVAAAYRRALDLAGDDAGRLRQQQVEWLKARNTCAADAACLKRFMQKRVEQLMQQ
jgi:hypothetical protein